MPETPGPVTITCPVCAESFTVPTTVLHVDAENSRVLVSMDRTDLYGHMDQCVRTHQDTPEHPQATREQRAEAMAQHPAGKGLERPLPASHSAAPIPPFVAKGTRPCVMCGVHATVCLANLDAQPGTSPCCGACGEGNTHPAKHETTPCALWPAQSAAH